MAGFQPQLAKAMNAVTILAQLAIGEHRAGQRIDGITACLRRIETGPGTHGQRAHLRLANQIKPLIFLNASGNQAIAGGNWVGQATGLAQIKAKLPSLPRQSADQFQPQRLTLMHQPQIMQPHISALARRLRAEIGRAGAGKAAIACCRRIGIADKGRQIARLAARIKAGQRQAERGGQIDVERARQPAAQAAIKSFTGGRVVQPAQIMLHMRTQPQPHALAHRHIDPRQHAAATERAGGKLAQPGQPVAGPAQRQTEFTCRAAQPAGGRHQQQIVIEQASEQQRRAGLGHRAERHIGLAAAVAHDQRGRAIAGSRGENQARNAGQRFAQRVGPGGIALGGASPPQGGGRIGGGKAQPTAF